MRSYISEVLRHQLLIHLSSGENISVRSNTLPRRSARSHSIFAQPHKSYYINMEYVDRFTPQNITMTNGDLIPIGRSRKNDFQHRLSEYIKGKRLYEHMD